MSTRQTSCDPARLEALGKFLAARRGDVAPPAEYLSGRRRVKGLRREEVAVRAGVSSDWYRKLEQGTARVSAEILGLVARALDLNPAETLHAFTLANLALPPGLAGYQEEEVTPGLREIIRRLNPCPVFVQGRRWDILASNQAASDVFLDVNELPENERNIVWVMFTSARLRECIVDWEGHAKRVLGNFRMSWAHFVGDPCFSDLIGRLRKVSPEFDNWWDDENLVGARREGTKEYKHPTVGKLVLLQTTLHVFGQEDPKIVVYTPLDLETEKRLNQLSGQK